MDWLQVYGIRARVMGYGLIPPQTERILKAFSDLDSHTNIPNFSCLPWLSPRCSSVKLMARPRLMQAATGSALRKGMGPALQADSTYHHHARNTTDSRKIYGMMTQ